MASTSSGQPRRSSKKKGEVDAVEFAALVTQVLRLRMEMRRLPRKGNYMGDVDQVSDLLSELSISESKNLSSKQKGALSRLMRLPPDKKARAIAKAMMEESSSEEEEEEEEAEEEESSSEEEEKQEKESTSEMPISDFRAVASQKKPEEEGQEKLHFIFDLKDLEKLKDRYKMPRAPELVEKDPEGKLFPLTFKKDSNGFYEIPPGVTCEVCGRSDHWRTYCPYLHKFPPGGEVKNKEAYQVVCHCGNPDPSRQACDKCLSGRGRGCHVVRKSYPIFVSSTYSKHLHNLISQRARNVGETPPYQPDPSNETYVPGPGFVDKYMF